MTEVENKLQQINDVVLRLLDGAKAISMGRRKEEGGEEIYQWQDIFDRYGINTNKPLFRTLEGHGHTDFVIDTDVEILTPYIEEEYTVNQIRELKLRAAIHFWNEWDKEHPEYKWTSYITGQGMYRVQRYHKEVDKADFIDILWGEKGILEECIQQKKYARMGKIHRCSSRCKGFFMLNAKNSPLPKNKRNKKGIGKIIELDNIKYLIIIDTSLYKRGRHVYRLPYTVYTKLSYETFYCVPVEYDNGEMNATRTILYSKYKYLKIKPLYYKEFQFEDIIKEVMHETAKIVVRRPYQGKGHAEYEVMVPEPNTILTDEQKALLQEMTNLVNRTDPFDTPPCIRNAWINRRDHWMRMILVRYLGAMRYDDFGGKGYTPDECALFIRFVVNDEEDNTPQNKDKIQLVAWTYGNPDQPDMPPHCDKMQDKKSEFYCCTPKDAAKCRRSYCMFPKPKSVVTVEKEKFASSEHEFEVITSLVSELVRNPTTNFEAIKTTRAGFTTSLIRAATFHGKRMLVVTPTNRIAREVFVDAMRLIYDIYGESIEGAVLSANMKACLKLRFTLMDLEKKKKENPNWGEEGVQWKNMMFQSKPSCAVAQSGSSEYRYCEYYEEVFEYPHREGEYPIPIIVSEHDHALYQIGEKVGKCAYRTIMERIMDYDIVFITYDKLTSLLSNVEKEAQEFVSVLYNSFDIVFMDEISKLVQASPLEITVYEQNEVGEKFFDYTYELSQDVARLIEKYNNQTINKIVELADEFINKFDPFIRRAALNGIFEKSTTYKIGNFLSPSELSNYKENFFSYYAMISKYAKDFNIHLNSLERMLVLLQNESWWMQSTPTPDKPASVVFTTTPKIDMTKQFVKMTVEHFKNQIIVTDATMPLAKISDVFGVDFKRFVIGDPRKTCDNQLVICGVRNVSAKQLNKHPNSQKHIEDLIKFVNMVCEAHGTENVMLVLPNKRFIYRLIQTLKRQKHLPYNLEVTWYRSDKTVGVGSKKRIMIAACPPAPPKGSHLWLARYYHEEELFQDLNAFELSDMLEKMNMHQTFYQTIGRVKDPSAKEQSLVYCWGISYNKVMEIIQMDEDVPIPHIAKMREYRGISSRGMNKEFIKIGKVWLRFGALLDDRFVRFVKYFEKHEQLTENRAKKELYLGRDFLGELRAIPNLLSHFGITWHKNTDGELIFKRLVSDPNYYI